MELGRNNPVAGVSKLRGVTEPTYFRERKEHGGPKVDQAMQFKELDQENAHHKRLLTDTEPDKPILREEARTQF